FSGNPYRDRAGRAGHLLPAAFAAALRAARQPACGRRWRAGAGRSRGGCRLAEKAGGRRLTAPAERAARGIVAGHTVYAAAGRRGAGAEEEARNGRAIRVDPGDRTVKVLQQVLGAAVDVAADIVGIVAGQLGRRIGVAGQNGVAKAGSVALDLCFDGRRHVGGRAVGHVAVSPGDVPPGRGAAGVEVRRLHEEHVGALRVLPAPDGQLAGSDLGQAAAQMHGAAGGHRTVTPGYRLAQGVVDLEGAGAVAVAFKLAAVAGR